MVKPRENRVPIMMSDEELKAIDDWRFANRVATRSDAIRRLAKIGIATDDWIDQAEKSIDFAMEVFMDSITKADVKDGSLNSKKERVYRGLMLAWLDVLTVTRVAATLRETGDVEEAMAEARRIRTDVWNEKIAFLKDKYPQMPDHLLVPNSKE